MSLHRLDHSVARTSSFLKGSLSPNHCSVMKTHRLNGVHASNSPFFINKANDMPSCFSIKEDEKTMSFEEVVSYLLSEKIS